MRVKKIKALEHSVAKGFIMDKRTLTEPDLSLSINEILKHHVRRKGETIKPDAYDEEGLGVKYSRMSNIDKELEIQSNRKKLVLLNKSVSEEIKQRNEIELQNRINEQVANKLKEASEAKRSEANAK